MLSNNVNLLLMLFTFVLIRDDCDMKDLLYGLCIRYLPADRSLVQRLIVRRRHVFDDAMQCLDLQKYIKVTFIREPAADEG